MINIVLVHLNIKNQEPDPFRRICKLAADKAGNLAYTNKPLKYVGHAGGEIFFVMVRILLALQVNNWNGKLKGIIEMKLLNKVKYSLKTKKPQISLKFFSR